MVDRQYQVERHRTQHRQQHLVERNHEQRGEHDRGIDAHLHGPGTQAETLLQIQRQDVHPTQAGTVTKQHQQSDAHGETAEQRRVVDVQFGETDPVRRQLGQQRHQGHRAERAQREGPAHPPDRQQIEGQVQGEEHQAEGPICQVLEQERQAYGTAGQQPRVAVERDAQRHHGGTQQQSQGIFPERVAHEERGDDFRGSGVRLVVLHRRLSLGERGKKG